MEVKKFLPEVGLIKDVDLRKKTEETILDAITRGGWEEEDLKRIPFTMLIKDTKISLIKHTRAVARTAIAIFESMKKSYGDMLKMEKDILISGALLHDVGKFLEYTMRGGEIIVSEFGKRVRHPVSGAALAYEHKLPMEVIHIIAAHSKEGEFVKRTPEAWIVNYADFINFQPFRE